MSSVMPAVLPATAIAAHPDSLWWAHCRRTLDHLLQAAQAGMVPATVWAAVEHLESWRRSRPERWRELVAEVCRTHPFWALMQQCPMTARASTKPRGYAGDAVMLDYIYDRRQPVAEPLAPQAEMVFRTLVECSVCGSVDYRRHVIAQLVDRVASERAAARRGPIDVLSLACGHARELDLMASVASGGVKRFVACDQDPESLATLARVRAGGPVQALPLAVRDFIGGRDAVHALRTFDVVYSAGLYDYLDQRLATRLTASLFERVAPGGQLLLANFHVHNRGVGFMEAMMDWWLVYRDDAQMRSLADDIDGALIAGAELFHDPFGNVVYLRLEKR